MSDMPDDLLGDFGPIAWKWLVRLIWLSSTITFQILEVVRYRNGETYRPFFGLFVAAECALLIWLVAYLMRERYRRIKMRRQIRMDRGY